MLIEMMRATKRNLVNKEKKIDSTVETKSIISGLTDNPSTAHGGAVRVGKEEVNEQ